MDFPELIADFATRHDVADLTAADNAAALDIDGIIVLLVAKGNELTISAEIGEPPAEGAAAFANLLLEASLESEAFFAKNNGTDQYIAVRRLPLAALDSAAFDTALESLVNLAETWRRLLADFRPAAEAAAKENADRPAFGSGGFLAV
jgi:ankyrin repeat protein